MIKNILTIVLLLMLVSESSAKSIRDDVEAYCSSTSFNSHVTSSFRDRGAKHILAIKRIFRKHHVPTILAYLPIIESGFNNSAVSSSGAKGAWQFMKETATDMGLQVNTYNDDRTDIVKSSEAAAKYFSFLKKKFHGDLNLMLAGYNGGPGYISRKMLEQNQSRFSKLSLYKETSDYIPKFWASVLIIKNGADCGL